MSACVFLDWQSHSCRWPHLVCSNSERSRIWWMSLGIHICSDQKWLWQSQCGCMIEFSQFHQSDDMNEDDEFKFYHHSLNTPPILFSTLYAGQQPLTILILSYEWSWQLATWTQECCHKNFDNPKCLFAYTPSCAMCHRSNLKLKSCLIYVNKIQMKSLPVVS